MAKVAFTSGKKSEKKGNTGRFSGGTGGHTAEGRVGGAISAPKTGAPPAMPMPQSR